MKRYLSVVYIVCLSVAVSFIFPPSKKYGEREVSLKITYKVNITGHINSLRLKMIIPATIKGRQWIKDQSFSIEPDSIYQVNSNTYALFKLYDLDKDFKIVIRNSIVLYNNISMNADTTSQPFTKYLVPEPNIEVESDKIISIAKQLKQANDIETTVKTFEYVKDHISYQRNKAIGAEKVLELGVGKCMDYSDLFVALLRANNIPAKSIFGVVVAEYSDNPLHAWPEVYLKKQGWIRFDPTTNHSEIWRDGMNFKMKISNKYIILSEGRNDPELHTNIFSYRYNYAPGGSLTIHHSIDVAGQE